MAGRNEGAEARAADDDVHRPDDVLLWRHARGPYIQRAGPYLGRCNGLFAAAENPLRGGYCVFLCNARGTEWAHHQMDTRDRQNYGYGCRRYRTGPWSPGHEEI